MGWDPIFFNLSIDHEWAWLLSGSRTTREGRLRPPLRVRAMAQQRMGLRRAIPVTDKCSGRQESQMPVGSEIRMHLARREESLSEDGPGWSDGVALAAWDQASWGKGSEAGVLGSA
jgi:hypothetical protein